MQGGFLKLVAGALVIGALMIFAAVQFIGTEANKGRLAQMADQPAAPEPAMGPQAAPVSQPIPQPMPEAIYEDDDWYGEEGDGEESTPEPFDPRPQFDDLPPEDLRFNPTPEPGVGQPQMITPDGAVPMPAPPQ